MDKYTTEAITRDADAFAQSRFGQHYLKRLEKALQRARDDAENTELSRDYRLTRSDQAAAINAEINYFKTATAVASNESLMAKLRAKAQGGQEPDIEL